MCVHMYIYACRTRPPPAAAAAAAAVAVAAEQQTTTTTTATKWQNRRGRRKGILLHSWLASYIAFGFTFILYTFYVY